ncbi:hypothetical protein [Actinoplanes sp. NPDC049681]|uniref:hypothetical protein n=1 Tax=Actinoplanes sp. NPDC049681 TaxID=3363905 RepID=UPI0037A274A0
MNGRNSQWVVPGVLLSVSVVSYLLLYTLRETVHLQTNLPVVDRIWSDVSTTILLAGIVLATWERSSRRDMERFVRRLSQEQREISERMLENVLERGSVRALLAEKITEPVFLSIQRQIIDVPVVNRDYRLNLKIQRLAEAPEFVSIKIFERYRLCNTSPESRVLDLHCMSDFNYEDRFPGYGRLTEVRLQPSRQRDRLRADGVGSDDDQTLGEDKLAQYAERLGSAIEYHIPTPRVDPGDEIMIMVRRTKIQRANDVNFWRALQATESVELDIEHDEEIEVSAFQSAPWRAFSKQVHSDRTQSIWTMAYAIMPHQGFDISWRVREPGEEPPETV